MSNPNAILEKIQRVRTTHAKEIPATPAEPPDPHRYEIAGLGRLEEAEAVTWGAYMRLLTAKESGDHYKAPDPLHRDPLKRRDWRQVMESQVAYNEAKADGSFAAALGRIAELEAERQQGVAVAREGERQERIAARRQQGEQAEAARQATVDAGVDAENARIQASRDGAL